MHYKIDNKLKEFVMSKFSINLDNYDDDQKDQILRNLNDSMDKQLNKENERLKFLLSEIRQNITYLKDNIQ